MAKLGFNCIISSCIFVYFNKSSEILIIELFSFYISYHSKCNVKYRDNINIYHSKNILKNRNINVSFMKDMNICIIIVQLWFFIA